MLANHKHGGGHIFLAQYRENVLRSGQRPVVKCQKDRLVRSLGTDRACHEKNAGKHPPEQRTYRITHFAQAVAPRIIFADWHIALDKKSATNATKAKGALPISGERPCFFDPDSEHRLDTEMSARQAIDTGDGREIIANRTLCKGKLRKSSEFRRLGSQVAEFAHMHPA
ncbi:hypothetical protein [Rhizobium freirei]|nr:hypothetical protein [Rhizobium freirei]